MLILDFSLEGDHFLLSQFYKSGFLSDVTKHVSWASVRFGNCFSVTLSISRLCFWFILYLIYSCMIFLGFSRITIRNANYADENTLYSISIKVCIVKLTSDILIKQYQEIYLKFNRDKYHVLFIEMLNIHVTLESVSILNSCFTTLPETRNQN